MPLLILKPFVKAIQAALVVYDKYWPSVVSLTHGGNTNTTTTGATTSNEEAIGMMTNTNVISGYSIDGNYVYFNTSSNISLASSADFGMGTGAVTAEFWVRPQITNSLQILLDVRAGAVAQGFNICIQANGNFAIYDGPAQTYANSTTVAVPNKWYHIAAVRSNGSWKLFVDGKLEATLASTSDLGATQPLYIAQWAGGGSYKFAGFMDAIRITKGVARYTSDFDTSTINSFDSSDPYWSSVKLALNFETGIVDVSPAPKTLTLGGTPIRMIPNPVNKHSMYLNGTNAYLTEAANTKFQLVGDFTLEGWIYPITQTSTQYLFSYWTTTATTCGFTFCVTASGATYVALGSGGTNTGFTSPATNLVQANKWSHVAVCRKGSAVTVYVNGTSVHSFTFAGALNNSSNPLTIGAFNNNGTPSNFFNGYLADFRITRGIARYQSNFSVALSNQDIAKMLDSSATDYAWDSTVLLMHMENLVDEKGHTVTPMNGAAVSSAVAKFGSNSLASDNTNHKWVRVSNSADLVFGANDFTVELWAYPTSASAGGLIGKRFTADSGTSAYAGIHLETNASLQVAVALSANGSSWNIVNALSTNSLVLNQWNHIALTRTRTTGYLTINGVVGVTITYGTSPIFDNNADLSIGATALASSTYPTLMGFNGYIDEVRITNGVGRYAGNFTVPSSKFYHASSVTLPNDSYWGNTGLVCSFDGSIADEANQNRNIAVNGSQAYTAGKFGQAFSFTGSNYLNITNPADLVFGTDDFTVEFWAKPNTTANAAVISNTTTSSQTGTFVMRANNNEVSLSYFNGSVWASVNSSPAIGDGSYHHIAFVRKANVLTIYVDGVSQASATVSQRLGTTAYPFIIGRNHNVGVNYTGAICDLRITRAARYSSNFSVPTDHFGSLKPGSVSQDFFWAYTALLVDGESITDLVGNTVTNNNNVVSTPSSKTGSSSLLFTQTSNNQSLSIPKTNFDLSSTDFTIEAWVNLSSYFTYGSQIIGIHKYGVSSDWTININPSGVLTCVFATSTTIAATSVIPLNTWTHIAVVRYNGTTYMYINGVRQSATTTVAPSNSTAWDLMIGSDMINTSLFKGKIDDLRVTKACRYFGNFIPPTYRLPSGN